MMGKSIRVSVFLSLLGLLLGLLLAGAQQEGPMLLLAEDDEVGLYLTDAAGNSLYLYLDDEAGPSTCVDACVNNWPPFLGEAAAGEGVDAALIGTVERPDGGLQVTYGGWPLYTYVRDGEPGTTRGAGLGGRFFLVSPLGEAALPIPEEEAEQPVDEAEAPVEEIDEELLATLMTEGEVVFGNICANCHGPTGGGGIGPSLRGHPNFAEEVLIIRQVLHGEHEMPGLGGILNDREVAAVVTYATNRLGGIRAITTEEEVAPER